MILCCLCGISIEPNDAAMCVSCLKGQVSITDDISAEGDIVQCGKCEKWHIRQDQWVHYEMESSGLLGALLKKVVGLQKHGSRVLEAVYIWTEPHSKRIKIAIEIERDVLDQKVKIKQKIVVEFTVRNKQCLECIRAATDHSWGALVQVRQFVNHKRLFFQLESMLIAADLHHLMMDVQLSKHGLDLFFKTKHHAERVVHFISANLPIRSKSSKKLVSRNIQNGTEKNEYTTTIEIAPLCKGDLVITPKNISGTCEVMVVQRLSSLIHLINPLSLRKIEITNSKYFSRPFEAICTAKHLVPFIVLDSRIVADSMSHMTDSSSVFTDFTHKHSNPKGKGKGSTGSTAVSVVSTMTAGNTKGALAEVVVVRESDFGRNDSSFALSTHLGHLLEVGDTVMGYDLQHMVLSAENESLVGKLSGHLPDVILVRKSYPAKEKKAKKRSKKIPPWMNNSKEGEITEISGQIHDEEHVVEGIIVDVDEEGEEDRAMFEQEEADETGMEQERKLRKEQKQLSRLQSSQIQTAIVESEEDENEGEG